MLVLTMSTTLLAARVARADDDDPAKGKFTLEQATKGLSGSGPLTAKIETTLGTFTCELYDKQAPITVANFVGLARGVRPWKDPKTGQWVEKKPFYDGLIFHRVIPGFMIQGGDPLGVGTGNPGYRFEDEFSPDLKFDKPALLAMANAGPATNGSQFFITEGTPQHLTGRHTIFGLCEPASLVSKITGVEARPARQTGDRRRHEEGDDHRAARPRSPSAQVISGRMKHFVLDTNVLIHDPRAILQFADNEVVIPIFVLEEVDNFKKEASERGRNAREVARMLDGLRANGGRLSDGVPLPEGGGRAARRLGGALGADHAAREPDRRPPDPDGGAGRARREQGRADDLRHQGRQPAHPRRRARADGDGLRGRAHRHRRALLGDDRAAGRRAPTSTRSTRRARCR